MVAHRSLWWFVLALLLQQAFWGLDAAFKQFTIEHDHDIKGDSLSDDLFGYIYLLSRLLYLFLWFLPFDWLATHFAAASEKSATARLKVASETASDSRAAVTPAHFPNKLKNKQGR